MKISLGFSNKKYSHDKSRDCNTTFPFGVVQPILSEYLLPDSDIKVHAKQLVRLSPLVVPSFARVSLNTVTRFVPESEVVPYSEAFYSKSSFHGSIPDSLPFINSPTLLAYLFSISSFCVYNVDNSTKIATVISSWSEVSKLLPAFYILFYTGSASVTNFPFPLLESNYFPNTSKSPIASRSLIPVPTIQGADYVVVVGTNYFCFNFGTAAKNFRNICKGLGYSLDMDDFTNVRFSPLLSFYKAYYDTYGIKRFKNFTQTSCYSLISQYIDAQVRSSYIIAPLPAVNPDGSVYNVLKSFFEELTNCYYSSDGDFVSIHRDSLQANSSTSKLSYFNASGYVSSVQNSKLQSSNDPIISNLSTDNVNLVGLQVLQRLSRFVNKNSILGQRISDYMRLHYGATDVSSLFKDSNFVDSSVLNCQINDVLSTSDTYDSSSNKGEILGAFAGKGIGFGDLSFKYHASQHGYLITLASIVPKAGYFQGNNFDLFALNWEQQPTPDFDAVGMEATSRSAILDHNSLSNRPILNSDDLTDKTFGFVPRYSGFKFAKNIVNGDMSRRGSIDDFCPYYLDHIISSNRIMSYPEGGNVKHVFQSAKVPSSSYDWRYICKYPWLGNFLRIFANESGLLDKGSITNLPVSSLQSSLFCIDDSFMAQIAFDVKVRNFLKPLSLSYDTFEESSDNASKDVTAS